LVKRSINTGFGCVFNFWFTSSILSQFIFSFAVGLTLAKLKTNKQAVKISIDLLAMPYKRTLFVFI
jgi:hypothetical protein